METIADSASVCRILIDPQQLAKLKIFIRRISRDDSSANAIKRGCARGQRRNHKESRCQPCTGGADETLSYRHALSDRRRCASVKLQIMFRALRASSVIIYALFRWCCVRGYEILDTASTFLDLRMPPQRVFGLRRTLFGRYDSAFARGCRFGRSSRVAFAQEQSCRVRPTIYSSSLISPPSRANPNVSASRNQSRLSPRTQPTKCDRLCVRSSRPRGPAFTRPAMSAMKLPQLSTPRSPCAETQACRSSGSHSSANQPTARRTRMAIFKSQGGSPQPTGRLTKAMRWPCARPLRAATPIRPLTRADT